MYLDQKERKLLSHQKLRPANVKTSQLIIMKLNAKTSALLFKL